MKVYIYTITRANDTKRAKRLLTTITEGRETAKYPAHWHVHFNASDYGKSLAEAMTATNIANSFTHSEENLGQHLPTNTALQLAQDAGYDLVIRVDDDCHFLTRGWLERLVDASTRMGPRFILSPTVKGLKHQMPVSSLAHHDDIPFVFIDVGYPMGGICRAIRTETLRNYPYVSDVRKPLGLGDAAGIGTWAKDNGLYCAYLKHIRVSHNTVEQEEKDSEHFREHAIFQAIPYIPILRG